jgi:hypothetical protein
VTVTPGWLSSNVHADANTAPAINNTTAVTVDPLRPSPLIVFK